LIDRRLAALQHLLEDQIRRRSVTAPIMPDCWRAPITAGQQRVPRFWKPTGRPEDVPVATADFRGEEHVDPFQGDRAVDVEEVHGQHRGGLRTQEPSPSRVGRS
jgi:hypothetical protein